MPDGSPRPAEDRAALRAALRRPEGETLDRMAAAARLDAEARSRIAARGADLVRKVRGSGRPGLMETFLAEYGLSTKEGVALMCLAEALLRTPDAETVDALIEDKIAPSDWSGHLGRATSPLVNASTWALMLTGRVLREDEEGLVGALRGAVKRLGEPVIRVAVAQAMKELGREFVLGRDIAEGLERARPNEARGLLYSYDMLGEAARTEADAARYMTAYETAIAAIAPRRRSADVAENPGISVKLSALFPRYEEAQRERALAALVPRLTALARQARSANMQLNVDAEEADRLELSLDVIEAALADPDLAGWDGFGAVVQAYATRAAETLDWLHALAARLDRRVTCRLVKGAYWDAEIKRAQVLGLDRFPVFTRKPASDVAWIACARKLMDMRDRILPQFATHNAHSIAAVLEMAGPDRDFEFQRLHGMGETLHEIVRAESGARCRVYAPVGPHRDLLAYLVRRLLENGANSSFVNQIVDPRVPPETIAADPFAAVEAHRDAPRNPMLRTGPELFEPQRGNARGWDLADRADLAEIEAARAPFRAHRWAAGPMLVGPAAGGASRAARNPADPADVVGTVTDATPEDVETALAAAGAAQPGWEARGAAARAAILRRAAELYEAHFGELFAIAAREAGKTPLDAVGELREAVDFLRYYAAEAERAGDAPAHGVFACVSPWNFPLAIFTGQIAAALAAGNAVVAKPAEQTPLMAARAVALLREAGVPPGALQLVPGDGPTVGGPLTADPRVAGVCFTGSLPTAQAIHRGMAARVDPEAPLIAETGGLNAMIVDSTALPEQAARDILASAFQSAGQRCSALRVLYVQEDVADRMREMLFGAMDALVLGDPWDLATDVGPVIDEAARGPILAHIARAEAEGRLLKRLDAPAGGTFVGPAVIAVNGIDDVEEEIFGPVLHLATFRAEDLERVVEAVNARGYGLTFGLHTRIDDRVDRVARRARVGNLYVNRNQIGAIVGSQPFGGEGLSGTGPKAGGPHYLPRFRAAERGRGEGAAGGDALAPEAVAAALAALPSPGETPLAGETLPGPTGESNRLALVPRGRVLCLGPSAEAAAEQARRVRAAGCAALAVAPGARAQDPSALDGTLAPEALTALEGFEAAAFWGDAETARALRAALARREGAILPLITEADLAPWLVHERHLCIDTTASGGDAALLARAGG